MFLRAIQRFLADEDGQDLIEWALLAAFIAIVVTTLLFMFRHPILNIYQNILDHLEFMSNRLPPTP